MVSVGLIGAGGISRAHAPGWLKNASSLFIYSLQGAEELAQEIEQIRSSDPDLSGSGCTITVCDDMAELLRHVDVVDICTPTDTHAQLVRTCLEADVDVLCEKPFTRHLTEARALEELARERGCIVYPAHVVRFFPAYVAAKRALESGEIGDLAVARFRRAGAYPSWSDWFGDEERSGGLIMDLLIHDLDQAVWMAGPVRTVSAQFARKQEGQWPVEQVDCTLTHESGALSQVQAIWGPQGMRFETEFHLSGSDGQLVYRSADDAPIVINGGQEAGSMIPPAAGESPYTLEIEDFLACRRGESEPRVSLIDGIHAVELAHTVARCAASGLTVTFHSGQE